MVSEATPKTYVPNTTQVPNIVIDHWMRKLERSQFLVLLVIVRKTLGWHKERDAISRRQLSKLTGLSLRSVDAAVKELEKLKLIETTHSLTSLGDPDTTTFQLLLYEEGVVQPLQGGSATIAGGGSATIAPTKDTLTKDTKTKEEIPPISPKGDSIEKPSFLTFGEHVKLTQAQYDKLVAANGKDLVHDIIEDMNTYCSAHGKRYTSYSAAFQTFLKRRQKEGPGKKDPEANLAINRRWAKEHEVDNGHFVSEACPDGFLVRSKVGAWQEVVAYNQKGFCQQCECVLRKRNLWK